MTSATNQLMTMCVNKIKAQGGWAFRVNAGKVPASYTTKGGQKRKYMIKLAPEGTPDVIGLLDGVSIAAEIKTGDDELTDAQLLFLLNHIDNKGVALIVRDEPQALLDVVNAITHRNPPPTLATLITRRHMIREVLEAYYHGHDRDELPAEAGRFVREIETTREGEIA